MLALSSHKDRSHIRRPQIQYFHEEVKKGNTGALEKRKKSSSESSLMSGTKNPLNSLGLGRRD